MGSKKKDKTYPSVCYYNLEILWFKKETSHKRTSSFLHLHYVNNCVILSYLIIIFDPTWVLLPFFTTYIQQHHPLHNATAACKKELWESHFFIGE